VAVVAKLNRILQSPATGYFASWKYHLDAKSVLWRKAPWASRAQRGIAQPDVNDLIDPVI
jgi:hypothetical protein